MGIDSGHVQLFLAEVRCINPLLFHNANFVHICPKFINCHYLITETFVISLLKLDSSIIHNLGGKRVKPPYFQLVPHETSVIKTLLKMALVRRS